MKSSSTTQGNPSANRPEGSSVEIQNTRVRVTFCLSDGLFHFTDLVTDQTVIQGAHAQIEQWSSCDSDYSRKATKEDFSDELGAGKRLTIECSASEKPSLLLEFNIYNDETSAIVLRTGLKNATGEAVRIHRFFPLADGRVIPGKDAQTLTGNSSCHQPEVIHSPYASSGNNLLLTFKENSRRRSLVLGALKTAEFLKWAHVHPKNGFDGRTEALSQSLPHAKLVAYIDCRTRYESLLIDAPKLSVLQGERDHVGQLVHPKEILIGLDQLDYTKQYALGFSWKNPDEADRLGSVKVCGANGKSQILLEKRIIPRGEKSEEIAVLVPAEISSYPRAWLQFVDESDAANISLDEVWLWEVPPHASIPQNWSAGHPVPETPRVTAPDSYACLEAYDPVGKLVPTGQTWLPGDSFYLDFGISNPFEALEKYGLQLRQATHASPNPYDFPSVCAWYAGVWHTEGAQNHPEKSSYQINTSTGMVEEAVEIKKSGFLKYSRVCGRLVPDTYAENNPQGWWDDEHWQFHGYYIAPYETSEKYGKGVHDEGCLAFTYIQPYCGWAKQPVSLDLRQQHLDWLCNRDINRSLDYTHPEVQEHLRRAFTAMRGHIDGLMIDYCDDHWDPETILGGFIDPGATSVSFYRKLFQLVKEGLGPKSWIHERNLWFPNNDLTLGFVDSQRTEADTDKISPGIVNRSGLRWYKNRVVIGYDMDSKDLTNSWKIPGWNGSDEDGRRMMLTLAYTAASRLLIANSFRDLTPETLHDLSRTFPYPKEPRSARPIDAFSHEGFSRVYDFAVTQQWHQVTLYNNTLPTKEETFSIAMSGDAVGGALGLVVDEDYYVFDFWNQHFVGRVKGSTHLTQTLRPGEARVLSIHQVEKNPQFISTDRHIMQGYLDFEKYPEWNPEKRELSGISKVIGGEPYRVVIALNGYKPLSSEGIEISEENGLAVLTICRPQNEAFLWVIRFTK